jgi:hypothetical protein
MRQDVWSKRTWEASPEELQARKDAAEAAKPVSLTKEQAEALNEQSKSNITVLSKEQAEALNEQNKPTVFTEAEAKEREAKALGIDDNVNNKSVDKPEKSGIINLDDTLVARSVGAKRKSYDVMDLQTGEHFDLVDGTYIRNKQVFAGKGSKTEFRKAEEFASRYGGNSKDWQHVKGIGTVNYHGEGRDAELHWAQCENIGMKEIFVKEWLE